MRILKYIFLLLVLFFIAASVFVATQKGDFDIIQSKVIKSPKNVVFNYVSDFRNWEDWFLLGDTKFKYTSTTAGIGSGFSWNGSKSNGNIQTVFIKNTDSISQKMGLNGLPAHVYWTFADVGGKTKVTWRIKGKMSFMPKIYAVLKGGAEKVMGAIYENSLEKLDKTLDYELNTYKIKVEGVADLPGRFYVSQQIKSTIADMPRNMRIMTSKLLYFFKKNNLPMAGKPFVIYKSFDMKQGTTRFLVCIPVNDEIYTSPESDINHGKLSPMRAVKTTLTGDYSHLIEAWAKTSEYMINNGLTKAGNETIEKFVLGRQEIKSPSKWVTEVYFPITNQTVTTANPPAVISATQALPKESTPTEEILIP